MSYKRVIPRDLFNEAKLLKCLGRLSLLILDGIALEGMELIHDDEKCEGFDIQQNLDGDLYVSNLNLKVEGIPFSLSCGMNSRENYPLVAYDLLNDEQAFVFDEDGNLSSDFLELCELKYN